MSRRRNMVAATALLAALAATGCGFGAGERLGEVGLTVTRDYGAEPVIAAVQDDVSESDTVMRVLERNAEITTRYGGGFVQSIGGIEAQERFDRSTDWFFYINGVEATVGAADYPLEGGEAVWWDYRDWSNALRVPVVVGSWPQPFTGGYEGRRRPVTVECMGGGAACGIVRTRLEQAGAPPAAGSTRGATRVLVGPWARVRQDATAATLEDGPEASGVFADFAPRGEGFELLGLAADGEPAQTFGPGAGLVAATRRYEAPPVWVVAGANAAGARAAAEMLDDNHLRGHYAIATEGGKETPLPLP